MSGVIAWTDLTVENAEQVKEFYKKVVGWDSEDVSMGEYNDFSMLNKAGDSVAGICHAKGTNADLPPVWMIYILVTGLEDALKECTQLGGEIVSGPKKMSGSHYAVIKDPAGAICALYEKT